MAFLLSREESVKDGIIRIINEQVDDCLNHIFHYDKDPVCSVHEMRKNFKRIRAVLRLVRKETGEKFYQRENIRFRDVGRLLAPVRETTVHINTLETLYELFSSKIDKPLYDKLKKKLENRRNIVTGRIIKQQKALPIIEKSLIEAKKEIADIPIGHNNFKALSGGLKIVYARGRKGYKRAYKKPNIEKLHEWRKRVKYFWHQTEILRNAWPKMLKSLSKSLDKLSDHLGIEHDLAELYLIIQEEAQLLEDQKQIESIHQLIAEKRKKEQEKAWSYGENIFYEKPSQFVERLAHYWNHPIT